MDKDFLSTQMQIAYDAAAELNATESYKIEAFKVALASILGGASTNSLKQANGVKTKNTDNEMGRHEDVANGEVPDWQRRVALKLGLTNDQVTRIYHRDDDDSLRLILNTGVLPKNNSLATQEIAVLLSAGRVAGKFDELATSSEIIRDEVDYYGRLDKSNFARALGKLKPNFNFNSRDKLFTPRAPGFAEAAGIAKKYLAVDREDK